MGCPDLGFGSTRASRKWGFPGPSFPAWKYLNLVRRFAWKWLSEKVKVLVAQSLPTLWDLMDCSPSGSSAHGILQARILEWIAISFSRGSSPLRDQTLFFCISGRFFTVWATREALEVITLKMEPEREGEPYHLHGGENWFLGTEKNLRWKNVLCPS